MREPWLAVNVPISAVIDALDNTEVIMLLATILVLIALGVVYALRRGLDRRRWALLVAGLGLTALLLAALPAAGGKRPPKPPAVFFGMSVQTDVPQSEYTRMKRNGAGSFRQGIAWNAVERSPGVFDFSLYDPLFERIARAGMEPFVPLGTMPEFYSNCAPEDCFRTLPTTASQRAAWSRFLQKVVRRYGPRGSFWSQNPGVPKRPVRNYQIWNEENFVFFTEPRSPSLYGALLKASHSAIRSVDRRAKVITGGLFMHPKRSQGIQGTTFLNQLYRVRGIKGAFEGVAIHPYAKDASLLRPDINAIRRVMKRNGDARTGLYITELGWGSGRDTAFEKGIRGQVRELGQAYRSAARRCGSRRRSSAPTGSPGTTCPAAATSATRRGWFARTSAPSRRWRASRRSPNSGPRGSPCG